MFAHFQSLLNSLGKMEIALHEAHPNYVRGAKLPDYLAWDDFVANKTSLPFRGLELAQAVITADFLQYRNPLMPGIGFVFQSHHIVDWSQNSFGLKPGGSTLLADFARTSLTGRLGQGFAILFAQLQGYTFKTHLREYLRSINVATEDSKGRALPIGDFVFEKSSSDRCIVEAKASFSVSRNCPKHAKKTLKDALVNQVEPWMPQINPAATKGFATFSCIREHGDPNADESTLTFVDPDRDDVPGQIALSSETLRKANYAAWFAAMGFPDTARRLRSLERNDQQLRSVLFALFELDNRKIAVPWFWGCPVCPGIPINTDFVVVGIDYEALKAVSAALQGNSEELMSLELIKPPNDGEVWAERQYSLFPDGTLFGSVRDGSAIEIVEVEI